MPNRLGAARYETRKEITDARVIWSSWQGQESRPLIRYLSLFAARSSAAAWGFRLLAVFRGRECHTSGRYGPLENAQHPSTLSDAASPMPCHALGNPSRIHLRISGRRPSRSLQTCVPRPVHRLGPHDCSPPTLFLDITNHGIYGLLLNREPRLLPLSQAS